MSLIRVQKVIAQAGIASRRKAEELILAGMVTINGQRVTKLGEKVDPLTDSIKVNGKRIIQPAKKVYYLVNKPRGYMCTVYDSVGRHTVMELVPPAKGIYPIGRLDYNSEGLILLTNDGELAHLLSRAGDHAPKTYEVKVQGKPSPEILKRATKGIALEDGTVLAPMRIIPIKKSENSPNDWFRMVLTQGKNRQIRRVFEEAGHRIMRLRRTAISFLNLDGISSGSFRILTFMEVERLKRLTANLPAKGRKQPEPGARQD